MNAAALFAVRVWVIDSSALIALKSLVPLRAQWEVFKGLEAMCEGGTIVVPRQALREVEEQAHPDGPGVWAAGVRNKFARSIEVDPNVLVDVLRRVPTVVDSSKIQEDADPYVVAAAFELLDTGFDPCVVTEDRIDRVSMSVVSACDALGIAQCGAVAFLVESGLLREEQIRGRDGGDPTADEQ